MFITLKLANGEEVVVNTDRIEAIERSDDDAATFELHVGTAPLYVIDAAEHAALLLVLNVSDAAERAALLQAFSVPGAASVQRTSEIPK